MMIQCADSAAPRFPGRLAGIRAVFARDERGVTAVEYALIAGALVLGIGVAFTALTGNLQTFLGGIAF